MTGVPGSVHGVAGTGLAGTPAWAANAEVAELGRRGEQRTATVLNRLARTPGGPTVLHDLRIPIPGFTANIDHVVVAGNRVTIVDTKVWKPGLYWTLGGRTRRGLERFEPADKQTVPAAMEAIRRYLLVRNVHGVLAQPRLVIWPSNTRQPLRLGLLRPRGASAVHGSVFERRPASFVGGKPANPAVAAALSSLVNH